MILTDLAVQKILNSRKEDSIHVVVETKYGRTEASAPSGKSRGKNEVEPYSEKGIDFSISFLKALGNKLINDKTSFTKFEDLQKIEDFFRQYDKTENLSMLGGNALFAVQAAVLKAMALSEKKPLWQFLNEKPKFIPFPLGNCIGGGEHVKSEKKPDFQEFLLLPKAKHFYDAYFANLQAYKEAKKLILQNDSGWKGLLTDENAIAPTLPAEEILKILRNVQIKIKNKFSIDLNLGIDMASSTLFKNSKYNYRNPPRILSKEEHFDYISNMIKEDDIYYIEDPFEEEDFDSSAKLLKSSRQSLICGDDLICTNLERLKKASRKNAVNAVIIKPNQSGSLIRTKEAVDFAKKNDITPVISHRSGETMDSTISDLAVGWQIPIIKTGILGRERFAKLHRLLKIEREMRNL